MKVQSFGGEVILVLNNVFAIHIAASRKCTNQRIAKIISCVS
ncbi:hypothetical protein APHCRT_0406 [Anaplasma phagocytophilum str. CRT53-1]|uniref:Uncharacterized protein n=2 Tax=Anaplasma phagocytophilum TaxID=948 RepID=A0A0F3Q603_ANAPH|nr:hypothetical protein CRT38_01605 [Anaplasma phagocytophilum str. CRT38]KJV87576.1 hypothetical protein APHCRT_0406 [Anaplasma phagocytophilum str. CRT53-1]